LQKPVKSIIRAEFTKVVAKKRSRTGISRLSVVSG
jgi:hypothetical protein